VNIFCKVNVDALIFTDCGSFGAGILIRDHNEFFVKAKPVTQSGTPEPREAEAWALMKAVQWITQLELNNVIIETDCKIVGMR